MKKLLRLIAFTPMIFVASATFAQLYKIALDDKVKHSTIIVEGKVVAQHGFWNDAHTMIYTSNTIEIYKLFKGEMTEKTIEVVTQGGSVGTQAVHVDHLLNLDLGKTGIFFCAPNRVNLKSPVTQKTLFNVYSSDQGFLRYNLEEDEAVAPFASYKQIKNNLYKILQQKTGRSFRVINSAFNVSSAVAVNVSLGTQDILATITSFAPTTVRAGALNDSVNNVLTITGTGFGATPSGSCAVRFKDGNSDITTPNYSVAYTSSLFISWSDTKIVLRVPARAATGRIAVVISDGSVTQSSATLSVTFSVLNFDFEFTSPDTTVTTEPRLMNTNDSGGYTFRYSTNTSGSGRNFATSPAKDAFERALNTWKPRVGVNFVVGATTAVQQIEDDEVNIIVYDNLNTGLPPMDAGVLEATYSFGSLCFIATPFTVYTAQKTGCDILIRNDSVSEGSVNIADGPCFPTAAQYDLESIILHELGHALNLNHINDDAQGSSIPNINPSKVMHYAISNYVSRRSLDNAAYQGGLYTVTKQNRTYGNCGLFASEMTPLSRTVISNDECPASFPSTTTPQGTIVNFDLINATSNSTKDPQYTAVNCATQGTSVTNNAWYAFRTGGTGNGTLTLAISGYVTFPAGFDTCAGQGIRLAIYDVSSCPVGQSFPQPVACRTFTTNGPLTNITGLLANHNYLLYFDGLRNTKASFSGTLNGSALPITLSDFSGEFINGANKLYINVLQAVNVKTITIEKSSDGAYFKEIGTLPFTNANLLGKHTYTDAQPFAGNNYYRLRIINNDGSAEYSNIILLKNESKRFIYIYPNPVKDLLSINFTATAAGRYNFLVYDVAGKLLVTRTQQIKEGVQMITLPLNNVAPGVYVVKIIDAEGNVVTRQNVIKQ